MIRNILFVSIWLYCFTGASYSQAYRIDVQLKSFDQDSMFLAYYYGNSQYLKDTAVLENGRFRFEGDSMLKPGVYMVVTPPDNQFFQVLVSAGEQRFSISADQAEINKTIKFEGSSENAVFYNYLNFLQEKGAHANTLRDRIKDAQGNEKAVLEGELEAVNAAVRSKQEAVINENPGSLVALLLRSNLEIDVPEDFEGTEEEKQMAQYRYFKDHYFDHIDLADDRIIHTPFLHERIQYYIEKLTFKVPDSIITSIDKILGEFPEGSDGYQFYLVHFLNEYAQSKVVGMDAVYVHLVETYYAKGKAPWIEQEQLDKMIKNAATLKPLLIGKKAPDLTLYRQDGTTLNVHDIQAPYTVLFFWDPDCGHCKKSIPKMIEFYDHYASRGVEILGICTKTGEKETECWTYVEEKGLDIWMNTSDKYLRSRYKQIYDIKTTPQIYILDKDKKIAFKRIGAEQLPGVLDFLLGQEEG